MGRVNIELESELHKKLKVECALKERTIQEYINQLLAKTLRKK